MNDVAICAVCGGRTSIPKIVKVRRHGFCNACGARFDLSKVATGAGVGREMAVHDVMPVDPPPSETLREEVLKEGIRITILRGAGQIVTVARGDLQVGDRTPWVLSYVRRARAVPRARHYVVGVDLAGADPLVIGAGLALDRAGAEWIARRLNQILEASRSGARS